MIHNRAGFEKHLKDTQAYIERLETIFKGLDELPHGKTCKAMEGLKEGADVIEEGMTDDVGDAALIAAAQCLEHYEIVGTRQEEMKNAEAMQAPCREEANFCPPPGPCHGDVLLDLANRSWRNR